MTIKGETLIRGEEPAAYEFSRPGRVTVVPEGDVEVVGIHPNGNKIVILETRVNRGGEC